MTTSSDDPYASARGCSDGTPGDCIFRRGTIDDAAELAAFAARTFIETYGNANDADNLQLYMAASYSPQRQASELANEDVATLLAHDSDGLAAFAQVRRRTPPRCVVGDAPIELQRFYIDSRWHGRGLATRMLAQASIAAREFGGSTFWLKVWEHNARALAFYTRAGFIDVGSDHFIVGNDRQGDRVLSIDLRTRSSGDDADRPTPAAD